MALIHGRGNRKTNGIIINNPGDVPSTEPKWASFTWNDHGDAQGNRSGLDAVWRLIDFPALRMYLQPGPTRAAD